jgi:hypothetical protein
MAALLRAVALCSWHLLIVNAHWGGSCPFLKKVVPEGEQAIAFVNRFLELGRGACHTFAEQFSDPVNFTTVCGRSGHVKTLTKPADIEQMCDMHHSKQSGFALTSVFPDFAGVDALFEVAYTFGGKEIHGLWRTHSCKQTGKITAASAMFGESSGAGESTRATSERFAKDLFESLNCGAWSDVAERDVSVHLRGDAHQVTHGGKTLLHGMEEARSACQARAARTRRITTSRTVSFKRHYYDASRNEITLIGNTQVTTVFRPGKVVDKPFALTLKFSAGGKVQTATFYGTEVVHLDQKWGTKYGKPVTPIVATPALTNATSVHNQLRGGSPGKAPKEGLMSLPPAIKSKKCAWLEERETQADTAWLKEKPWYNELVDMCAQLHEVDFQNLPAPEVSKQCASIGETSRRQDVVQVTRVRILSRLCSQKPIGDLSAMSSQPSSKACDSVPATLSLGIIALAFAG